MTFLRVPRSLQRARVLAGDLRAAARKIAKQYEALTKSMPGLRRDVSRLQKEMHQLQEELRALRRELRDRLLQYHLQLGRLAQAQAGGDRPVRLSGRAVPTAIEADDAPGWLPIGSGEMPPDPEGREWLRFDHCPVCAAGHGTVVSPWNKGILLDKAPDADSVRYDYALCDACGVLYASRRPCGNRYRFLLEHFGEVTAKRGGSAEIRNRLLNPYPLTDDDRAELRRLAKAGVFVSDHLGLSSKQYLAPLLRDRLANSVHTDIIGSLVEPRGARVLEVRSRAGTILDGLRRAWGAEVYAMPIWESQQFLLQEVYGIPTSALIDFEQFDVPFDGPFDLIICNHMFTHALHPRPFFATLAAKLRPGGYLYLHNEPDDAEFLAGKQSMLATLNPLHMQAFDQRSLVRALAANGFETVFLTRLNLTHVCLARRAETVMVPLSGEERARRLRAYEDAYARAVLRVDERIRPRFAKEWDRLVEHAVARGVAEFDERGLLRLAG
jgi:SAM-dependent methyltransferase